VNYSEVTATIWAGDIVISGERNLETAAVTVVSPGGVVSNPEAFTIVGPYVGVARSQIAPGGETVAVAVLPAASAEAGVAAVVDNSSERGQPIAWAAFFRRVAPGLTRMPRAAENESRIPQAAVTMS